MISLGWIIIGTVIIIILMGGVIGATIKYGPVGISLFRSDNNKKTPPNKLFSNGIVITCENFVEHVISELIDSDNDPSYYNYISIPESVQFNPGENMSDCMFAIHTKLENKSIDDTYKQIIKYLIHMYKRIQNVSSDQGKSNLMTFFDKIYYPFKNFFKNNDQLQDYYTILQKEVPYN